MKCLSITQCSYFIQYVVSVSGCTITLTCHAVSNDVIFLSTPKELESKRRWTERRRNAQLLDPRHQKGIVFQQKEGVHSVASEWNGKWTHFLPVSLLTFNNPTSHSADLLVLDSDWICNKRLKETDGRNGERDGLTFILGGVEAVGRCLVWWRRPWRNLRWTRRICWNEEKSRWRRRQFDRADEDGS